MDVLSLGKKHPDFQKSMAYLVGHPDEPLAGLHAHFTQHRRGWRTIPPLLAAIGRAESIPVLATALSTASASDAWKVGTALGSFPSEMSAAALLSAMKSSRESEVIAAIQGVRVQKNASVCDALTEILKGDAPQPRYHALRACSQLGCISTEEVKAYLNDADVDVATLAQSLLSPQP